MATGLRSPAAKTTNKIVRKSYADIRRVSQASVLRDLHAEFLEGVQRFRLSPLPSASQTSGTAPGLRFLTPTCTSATNISVFCSFMCNHHVILGTVNMKVDLKELLASIGQIECIPGEGAVHDM